MKKIAIALIISSLIVSLASCGGEQSSADSGAESSLASMEISAPSPITAEEFKAKLLEKVAFDGDMIDCTKLVDYPLDTHGIENGTYSSYVYLEVSDTTNSYETIIVFSATSKDNAAVIKESLDKYISNLKAQFENYNATIVDMVNKSVVKADGEKVYLIISPNVEEIEKVVKANLGAFN